MPIVFVLIQDPILRGSVAINKPEHVFNLKSNTQRAGSSNLLLNANPNSSSNPTPNHDLLLSIVSYLEQRLSRE